MFKQTMLVVGLAIFAAVVMSGCGSKSLVEKRMENEIAKQLEGKAQVDLGNNGINVETNEGSIQVGGNVELPADFPKDVYIIEGKMMSAMKNAIGAGFQVMIQTTKSLTDAKSIYQSKLKEAGWAVTNASDTPGGAIVSGQKGRRQVVVAMGTEDGQEGLAVVITVIEEQV